MPTLDIFCSEIADDLKRKGLEYPKTIVFCWQYTDCAAIYHTLRSKLGENFTFPPRYSDISDFRLVDMYTRASTIHMKEKVLSCLCNTSTGVLRLVIATTAFGMGIDSPDIRCIMHWGSPSSLEESNHSRRASLHFV
jgi:bloom syndrome protein